MTHSKSLNRSWTHISIVLETPVVPEHEHDDGLDCGGLEALVWVGVVLQGHAVELPLVDVGHLVVLAPHRGRGRGVQDVAEAVRRVDLGDLDLLRVAANREQSALAW